jgi:hypothetical protein
MFLDLYLQIAPLCVPRHEQTLSGARGNSSPPPSSGLGVTDVGFSDNHPTSTRHLRPGTRQIASFLGGYSKSSQYSKPTQGTAILRRHLALKLIQWQVATQLGTNVSSLRNWEANPSKPTVEFMPAIIQFLGYNPLPPSTTWASVWFPVGQRWGSRKGEPRIESAWTKVHSPVGNGASENRQRISRCGRNGFPRLPNRHPRS